MEPNLLDLDSGGSFPVIQPASVPEVGHLVRQQRAQKQAIYPVGGRTTLDLGCPPLKHGIALDTTALSPVIDYPARDMTITVGAGIPVAELQNVLAKEGQWLPIDVSQPERATLGGAIAANQSGPRRYGYGTLRDYVIGISFVTDEGVEVKAGGRVVKNVAGYDLMKLQIGALGTLGIVTQATLKLKPRPEASVTAVFGCAGAALGGVLDVLHASRSRPVAVELLNRDAVRLVPELSAHSSQADWTVVVGFEEKATTVRWQFETLLGELKAVPVQNVAEIQAASGPWSALANLQTRSDSQFIGKASVLPSRVAASLQEWSPRLAGTPIHAHALNGVIWLHSQEPLNLGDTLTVRRCPPELKRTLSLWGKPGGDWEMMRHVKKTLDPDGVFNPGRLFGDL